MAAPTQNQAQRGSTPNALHDQGIPNTLGGIGSPTTPRRSRLSVRVFVIAVVVIVVVLVSLVARPA